MWLTCIHEESFVKAGELGVGVLGYLMNQTVDEVAAKIGKYREALAQHGHDPAKGHVTILVHTFLSATMPSAARERARGPLREYLRVLPRQQPEAARKPERPERGRGRRGPRISPRQVVQRLRAGQGADRFAGILCAAVVERLREIGVDEIGCFVDFGVDTDAVLASLPALDRLRARYAAAPEPSADRARELPCTESQHGLWVLGQTGTDALRAYHESTTLALRGPLDEPRLRGALQAAVNRHEALRTTIHRDGETQVVHPAASPEVAVTDLSGLEAGARPAACAQSLRDIEGRTFDFERGPLLPRRADPARRGGAPPGPDVPPPARQRAFVLGLPRGTGRALRRPPRRPGNAAATRRLGALAQRRVGAHPAGGRGVLGRAVRGRGADARTARGPSAARVALPPGQPPAADSGPGTHGRAAQGGGGAPGVALHAAADGVRGAAAPAQRPGRSRRRRALRGRGAVAAGRGESFRQHDQRPAPAQPDRRADDVRRLVRGHEGPGARGQRSPELLLRPAHQAAEPAARPEPAAGVLRVFQLRNRQVRARVRRRPARGTRHGGRALPLSARHGDVRAVPQRRGKGRRAALRVRPQHRPVRGRDRPAVAGPLPDTARRRRRRPGSDIRTLPLLGAAERRAIVAGFNETRWITRWRVARCTG